MCLCTGVNSTCVVEKGRNILSASRDGCVRLWDVGQQTCLHVWEDIGAGEVNHIATSQVDSSVRLGTRPTNTSKFIPPD